MLGLLTSPTSRKNFIAANKLHLKYVDDLSIAESVTLKDNVHPAPDDRQWPDPYRARTGHKLILGNSKVFKQIHEIMNMHLIMK